MTGIQIKNLRLRAVIGANDWEREVLQDVVISIRFKYDAQKAEMSDQVEDVFNYKTLTKRIIDEVEASRFNLLESLVNHVYKIVKENKEVQDVTVTVEKPNALRFCDNVIAVKSDKD
ncbi:MAG: FolB domain-containing protein [Marinilabiliales bacterium]|nr:MAG: FolB domain-containing protein [Marinilabiliales bacterium]